MGESLSCVFAYVRARRNMQKERVRRRDKERNCALACMYVCACRHMHRKRDEAEERRERERSYLMKQRKDCCQTHCPQKVLGSWLLERNCLSLENCLVSSGPAHVHTASLHVLQGQRQEGTTFDVTTGVGQQTNHDFWTCRVHTYMYVRVCVYSFCVYMCLRMQRQEIARSFNCKKIARPFHSKKLRVPSIARN